MIWDRLISIVEEQAQALIRTAFSTTVREAGDLSAGIFDLSGKMLAQAVTGTPGHVNAMATSVGYFLETLSLEKMRPGDVYLTNDPWKGTGHLFDFTVVTPAFIDENLVGLLASTVHVVDIGGRGFGPDAGQIYEEGLCIPILPLFEEGKASEAIMSIVRANVREPTSLDKAMLKYLREPESLRTISKSSDANAVSADVEITCPINYLPIVSRRRRFNPSRRHTSSN